MKKGKKDEVVIDPSKPYQFIAVDDTGGGACCPHCGAEGRYIYIWAEFGKTHAAMAGCFKMLTGKLDKGDIENFMQGMAERQAKNKPLNGWQKTVLRMYQFIEEGRYSEDWCMQKIREAIAGQRAYAAGKGR